MASTEISIKQLPTINSIESGNSLIVQTDNATAKLDFKDFVIGLENTTFANTLTNLNANDAAVTANTTRSTVNATNITANTSNIAAVTTKVDSLETSVGGLNLDANGGVTFTTLSAGSLSANGTEFKGYPSHNQVIYKGFSTRQGTFPISLDLVTTMNLKSVNSKVKVSFSIPGMAGADTVNGAFVVQESANGTTWTNVGELLSDEHGLAATGAVVMTSNDAQEMATTSFAGLFTPAALGTGNNIYIRIVLKLDSAQVFYQNFNGQAASAQLVYQAVGISTVLIEEVFV